MKNRQAELLITGIGSKGQGVGRLQGKVVFVPYVIPGEKVLVQVVKEKKRSVMAEPLMILTAAPDRVDPVCKSFGRCGGCQLMHVNYPAQCDLKRWLLHDALQTIAGIDVKKEIPVAPAQSPWLYRSRGQYPVAYCDGEVATGFFERRSHRLVPCPQCHIHDRRVDSAVQWVRQWANRHAAVKESIRQSGWLKQIRVRVGQGTGQLLVALLVDDPTDAPFGDLVNKLRDNFPDLRGVLLQKCSDRSSVRRKEQTKVLWGDTFYTERFGDLTFSLSMNTFFQVHAQQASLLFEKVVGFLEKTTGLVIDAYCGVGILSMYLAAKGLAVVGVEKDASAIDSAMQLAENHGLDVCFLCQTVEQALPKLLVEPNRPGAIVLDPPRQGCHPSVLQAVIESPIKQVAYVSCHPGTLARDLVQLKTGGFQLVTLEAVDMFPQTTHLELFVGLCR